MESFDKLKFIWKNEQSDLILNHIESDDIIKQYIRKKKTKNFVNFMLLLFLLAVLIFLLGFANFKMWTTYLGLTIFILVTFYLIYIKRNNQDKFSNLELLDNNEYLSTLEKEKNETCIGETKIQTNLFILYAIGFGFYIYESASQTTTSLVIGYGALLVYLLAAKFFYFPLVAKRNLNKTNEIIQQIIALKHQYNENK